MIEHVYRRATASPSVAQVIVATDDLRIASAVQRFGGDVRMTRPDHVSGTDRLAEVAATLDCDIVVNVQGTSRSSILSRSPRRSRRSSATHRCR